jgi:dienelactone hydrolase
MRLFYIKYFILYLNLLGLIPINTRANIFQIKTEHIYFSALIDKKNYRLEAMIYTPLDNRIQHSLIIMTHGRHGPSPKVDEHQVFHYRALCQSLAESGYLVMMLVRRGYGDSEGPDSEYLDTPEESALAGAKDIKGAINYMITHSEIAKDHIVIIGQSQGGWVSLASSTLDINGVLGVVNISGATNFRQAKGKSIHSLEVERALENSVKYFGKTSHVPALWIYAENDNHLPDAVKKWFNSFIEAGGKGKLVIKPPYKDRGHAIVNEPDIYIGDIINFFEEIGFNN